MSVWWSIWNWEAKTFNDGSLINKDKNPEAPLPLWKGVPFSNGLTLFSLKAGSLSKYCENFAKFCCRHNWHCPPSHVSESAIKSWSCWPVSRFTRRVYEAPIEKYWGMHPTLHPPASQWAVMGWMIITIYFLLGSHWAAALHHIVSADKTRTQSTL